MKKIEEILKRVDELEKTEFVTAKFGNNWKQHAKENYDMDALIEIAHKQGRRAILLEMVINELL
jgi:Cys-tRNA synthase (O-phospho-L-seryl-tRNA:Cys-tRNA synthase)